MPNFFRSFYFRSSKLLVLIPSFIYLTFNELCSFASTLHSHVLFIPYYLVLKADKNFLPQIFVVFSHPLYVLSSYQTSHSKRVSLLRLILFLANCFLHTFSDYFSVVFSHLDFVVLFFFFFVEKFFLALKFYWCSIISFSIFCYVYIVYDLCNFYWFLQMIYHHMVLTHPSAKAHKLSTCKFPYRALTS